ncbi:hypothetical protein C0Q70_09137 [Pomacea canaliculata]|uniref:Uncharacterized protein n=1 Tax=Pomacea canaliculata TaxID=400727 RepID=A0A2T7P8Z1_POMCA|nr:hypothetical protein C0Q70_09137 [Pomacea canaliculata]
MFASVRASMMQFLNQKKKVLPDDWTSHTANINSTKLREKVMAEVFSSTVGERVRVSLKTSFTYVSTHRRAAHRKLLLGEKNKSSA